MTDKIEPLSSGPSAFTLASIGILIMVFTAILTFGGSVHDNPEPCVDAVRKLPSGIDAVECPDARQDMTGYGESYVLCTCPAETKR